MYSVFYDILGFDFTSFFPDDTVAFTVVSLVILFIIGEIFNIIRQLFKHITGG